MLSLLGAREGMTVPKKERRLGVDRLWEQALDHLPHFCTRLGGAWDIDHSARETRDAAWTVTSAPSPSANRAPHHRLPEPPEARPDPHLGDADAPALPRAPRVRRLHGRLG